MPDDDGTEGGDEETPTDWRALEERYNAEPDPEPEEFDPNELGPDIPEAPDLTEVDASAEVRYRFWALVMVFNVALLAASLGVMFVVFQGAWGLGGQLTLAGLLLFGFGYYRYRQTKAALAEKDGDSSTSEEEADDSSTSEEEADDSSTGEEEEDDDPAPGEEETAASGGTTEDTAAGDGSGDSGTTDRNG